MMDNRELLQQAIVYAKQNKSFNKYNVVMNAKNVCVFGLGTYFKEAFVSKKAKERYHVNLLCDNNPERWGTYVEGLKCVCPDELKNYNDLIVIIMLGNPQPVCEQLDKMGVRWVTHLDLSIDEELGFTRDEEETSNSAELILNSIDTFEDEESKRIYSNALANRIALGMGCAWKDLYSDGQYFGQEFMKFSDNEAYVDCGAYNGDTVLQFTKVCPNYFHIHAFELDKVNYDNLLKNTKGLEKISYYNKGVYDHNTQITYALGDGDNEPMGGNSIMKKNVKKLQSAQVVKLDDELKDQPVTFVKMDIEGSEMNAIRGMKHVIQTQKPKLAVCVYHKTSDFWEVPKLLREYNSNYKLYLRHHSFINCLETVCYAVDGGIIN